MADRSVTHQITRPARIEHPGYPAAPQTRDGSARRAPPWHRDYQRTQPVGRLDPLRRPAFVVDARSETGRSSSGRAVPVDGSRRPQQTSRGCGGTRQCAPWTAGPICCRPGRSPWRYCRFRSRVGRLRLHNRWLSPGAAPSGAGLPSARHRRRRPRRDRPDDGLLPPADPHPRRMAGGPSGAHIGHRCFAMRFFVDLTSAT
jgi:hypothetical protein